MATNENLIPIPGRLHSVASDEIVSGADEIYDDKLSDNLENLNTGFTNDIDTIYNTIGDNNEKGAIMEQLNTIDGRLDTIDGEVSALNSIPIEVVPLNSAGTAPNVNNPKLNTLYRAYNSDHTQYSDWMYKNGSWTMITQLLEPTSLEKLVGYYTCDTAANTPGKEITTGNSGYVLPANGGAMKIKMINANTADNVTLKIGSETAKPLWYNDERASSSNTWEEGEVILVYYDGENYKASNAMGGGSAVGKKKLKGSQGYVSLSGTTAPNPTTSGGSTAQYRYIQYPVKEGDVVEIKGKGNGSAWTWALIDTTNNRTIVESSNGVANYINVPFVKVIPSGVDMIIINNYITAFADYEWYYAKAGSIGAHEILTDEYIYRGLKKLSIGTNYNENEVVQSIGKQIVKVAKAISSMSLSEEIATKDLRTYNGNTFEAQGNIKIYTDTPDTPYVEGSYAIGSPSGVIIEIITDENIGTIDEAVEVSVTINDVTISITVDQTSTPATIATDIYNNFGTQADWKLTDNGNGTLTLISKGPNTEIPTISFEPTESVVSIGFVQGSDYSGTTTLSQFTSGVWTSVPDLETYSVADIWSAVTDDWLGDLNNGVIKQTYIPNLHDSFGDDDNGVVTQKFLSETLSEHEVYNVRDLATPYVIVTNSNCGSNQHRMDLSIPTGVETFDIIVETPKTNGVLLKELRFNNGSNKVKAITNIPLDGKLHRYNDFTLPKNITRIYDYEFSRTGSYGKLVVYVVKPWGTVSTAIRHIPTEKRKEGLIIKFLNPDGNPSMYKYIGSGIDSFDNVANWKRLDSCDDDVFVLHLNKFGRTTGGGIMANPNNADFGKYSSSTDAVSWYNFIPCEGYDYLDINLWPSSGNYNLGLVFYDKDRKFIRDYGSMSMQVSSVNTSSPYWHPVHLEIPSNAVWFKTTYRGGYTPPAALLRGNARVYTGWTAYEYKGEKIDLNTTHTMRLARYMYLSIGNVPYQSHQGACVWGDYFFAFDKNDAFSVLDMRKTLGPQQTPIQSAIRVPGMATSNIHNDSVFFTNRYYASGDEFPLLLCGGGTGNSNGITYFYALRIIKNVDETTGTITFSASVAQTITVQGSGSVWMTPYYDSDRGVICSSHGGKTVVTNKTVSGTAGDFTLDLTDPSNIIQEFPNYVHSAGAYCNGKLFGVYDNDGLPLFLILDIYTGKYISFRIPRWAEPEGVVLWNGDLYIYYVNWLGKVYFE